MINQKNHEINARKYKDTTTVKSHLKEKAQAEAHLKELAMRKEKFFSGFADIKSQVSASKTKDFPTSPARSRSPQSKVDIVGIVQINYEKLLTKILSLEQM